MFIYVNHDDLRSLEFMEELMNRHYYVSDEWKDLKYADMIYLGVKGIDRKQRLMLENETKQVDLKDFSLLKKDCLVLTLMHNSYLEELSQVYHFRYLAMLDDAEFLKKNSILTAEGLISYLISHRQYPLYQSRIYVLGFGHCAKPMIRYLVAFGADVYVVVRKPQLQKEIEAYGAHYLSLDDIDLSDVDILVNTIPHIVIKPSHIDQASRHIMMVDIASYPYGIDHHYALSQGFNCQILPSIPCKYAYGFAGKMMADIVEGEIENA